MCKVPSTISKVTLAKSREQPRSTRSRWSKLSASQGSRLALSGSSRVRYDAATMSNCPSLMNLNFVRLASKRQTLLAELQEPSLTGCSSGWSRSATQPWWERRRSDFQCQHIRLGSFHFFRHHLTTFTFMGLTDYGLVSNLILTPCLTDPYLSLDFIANCFLYGTHQ